MAFLDNERHFRSTDEVEIKLKEIFDINQDKYESLSHVIRCAIIKLHVQEGKNNGKNPGRN